MSESKNNVKEMTDNQLAAYIAASKITAGMFRMDGELELAARAQTAVVEGMTELARRQEVAA